MGEMGEMREMGKYFLVTSQSFSPSPPQQEPIIYDWTRVCSFPHRSSALNAAISRYISLAIHIL